MIQTLIATLICSSFLFYQYGRSIWHPKYLELKGKRSIEDVVDLYGEQAETRLQEYFQRAGSVYPPARITLIAFKDTKTLDLWASPDSQPFNLIHSYPIKGASGHLGPKLREGDKQVPEGIYTIEGLNPNSSYHLSMKLNYPNSFDWKYAKMEGRNTPGSNIFIHGKTLSVGCLAMGDKAIEELFILANTVGIDNIEVLIAPTNLGIEANLEPLLKQHPPWVADLYKQLQRKLQPYYVLDRG
ncbi:L,D-transpeptidase family protein [Desulfogranum japonicum]|uniref:L,D-transpeptidase family protein n=1 Tax=Desulfogranum japonicum TaxID=231447 RepID=UPI000414CAF5|nr:L,D-transpeptidase family protein [Desulfogranum japonicum]